MAKEKIHLTPEGLETIKAEYAELINEIRPANVQAIKEALALGDLSENSEYHAAKDEQLEIETKIKKVENILENYSLIEEITNDVVGLGNTVELKYIDDEEVDEYKIVGSHEANPFESKISNESPIALAILDKKVGDVVVVESPNGSYQVEITAIS